MLCHQEFSNFVAIVPKLAMAKVLAKFELTTSQQTYNSKKKNLGILFMSPSEQCQT